MSTTQIEEPLVVTRDLTFDDVVVGAELPAVTVDLTPTLVIATALATRDFEEVHHDVDVARAAGLDNIFLNILATNGLCQRLVIDWAGRDAIVRRSSVRLGVPALAGDQLALTAAVTRADRTKDGPTGEVEVEVTGMVSTGRHALARITITLPTTSNPEPDDE